MTGLLQVEDLHTSFFTDRGVVEALRGVSFELGQGEIVGLVGESGSGKSVTAASILRLVRPPGRIVKGRVQFEGRDLVALPESELRKIRGRRIGLVLQNPRTALNPVLCIGDQMVNIYRSHVQASRKEAWEASLAMLAAMGLSDVRLRAHSYPHEFSGGSAQRVLIAIALLCEPRLLLADEPTTALDVTIQAQILNLLRESIDRSGSSALLITHDLGVVAHYTQRILVMYRGQIVEDGPTATVLRGPAHPYTASLVAASVPGLALGESASQPELANTTGCVFADRCPLVHDRCLREAPLVRGVGPAHRAACHLLTEEPTHSAA